MKNNPDNFEVVDRKSFIEFLYLLRENLINNPENWENKTLPEFLEALASYTEDIQGYYDNMKLNKNSDIAEWSIFADILKGAKIYE